MTPIEQRLTHLTRRTFVGQSARGIGGLALGSMLMDGGLLRASTSPAPSGGLAGLPHFAPKAKRVLCLFQSGGLSHVDLFDQKPELQKFAGQDLPASIKGTQRVTGMTASQASFPVVPPMSRRQALRQAPDLDQRHAAAHADDRR